MRTIFQVNEQRSKLCCRTSVAHSNDDNVAFMTPFEYITVLVSIVLGLGITQVVTGTADIIHNWNRVRLYWPHLLWIVLVFFLHLQDWWSLYDLRQHQQWRLPTFFFTILYPINLFILARVLFPGSVESGVIDMKTFYFSSYRKFFLLIATLAVISFIDNVFINSYPLEQQFIPVALMGVMGYGAARGFHKEWIHQIMVVVLVLVVLVSVAVKWEDWTLTL